MSTAPAGAASVPGPRRGGVGHRVHRDTLPEGFHFHERTLSPSHIDIAPMVPAEGQAAAAAAAQAPEEAGAASGSVVHTSSPVAGTAPQPAHEGEVPPVSVPSPALASVGGRSVLRSFPLSRRLSLTSTPLHVTTASSADPDAGGASPDAQRYARSQTVVSMQPQGTPSSSPTQGSMPLASPGMFDLLSPAPGASPGLAGVGNTVGRSVLQRHRSTLSFTFPHGITSLALMSPGTAAAASSSASAGMLNASPIPASPASACGIFGESGSGAGAGSGANLRRSSSGLHWLSSLSPSPRHSPLASPPDSAAMDHFARMGAHNSDASMYATPPRVPVSTSSSPVATPQRSFVQARTVPPSHQSVLSDVSSTASSGGAGTPQLEAAFAHAHAHGSSVTGMGAFRLQQIEAPHNIFTPAMHPQPHPMHQVSPSIMAPLSPLLEQAQGVNSSVISSVASPPDSPQILSPPPLLPPDPVALPPPSSVRSVHSVAPPSSTLRLNRRATAPNSAVAARLGRLNFDADASSAQEAGGSHAAAGAGAPSSSGNISPVYTQYAEGDSDEEARVAPSSSSSSSSSSDASDSDDEDGAVLQVEVPSRSHQGEVVRDHSQQQHSHHRREPSVSSVRISTFSRHRDSLILSPVPVGPSDSESPLNADISVGDLPAPVPVPAPAPAASAAAQSQQGPTPALLAALAHSRRGHGRQLSILSAAEAAGAAATAAAIQKAASGSGVGVSITPLPSPSPSPAEGRSGRTNSTARSVFGGRALAASPSASANGQSAPPVVAPSPSSSFLVSSSGGVVLPRSGSARKVMQMHLSPLSIPSTLGGKSDASLGASVPLSPLSPLPGTLHPYSIYLAHQTHFLHPLPSPPPSRVPVATATTTKKMTQGAPIVDEDEEAQEAEELRASLRARRLLPPAPAASTSSVSSSSTSPTPGAGHGFLFLFLDRLIDEGENFLLYSYPSLSVSARKILGMKGLLSVLEGAVAAVTGQRAQVGVLEETEEGAELSAAMEADFRGPKGSTSSSASSSPPSTSTRPPLRVKACSRELGGIGRGAAFICLTWHPLISDTQLQVLTSNILRSLRTTLGPLHSALFKPWDLLSLLEERALDAASGENRAARKRKRSKLQPFWSALQRHRGGQTGVRGPFVGSMQRYAPGVEELQDDADAAANEQVAAEAVRRAIAPHAPVMVADLLPSLLADPTTDGPFVPPTARTHSASDPQLQLLPSDLVWSVTQRQRQQRRAQQRAKRAAPSLLPAAAFTDLAALGPVAPDGSGEEVSVSSVPAAVPASTDETAPAGAAPVTTPSPAPASSETVTDSDAAAAAAAPSDGAPPPSPRHARLAQEQLRRQHTVLCSSWESMLLLDRFFERVASGVAGQLLKCAGGMARLGGPERSDASAGSSGSTMPSSQEQQERNDHSAPQGPGASSWTQEVVRMHLSPFLSPSLVPRFPPLTGAWGRAVSAQLDQLLSAIQSQSRSQHQHQHPHHPQSHRSSLLLSLPHGSPASSPSSSPDPSPASPAPLGALLFHNGSLVHVARLPAPHPSMNYPSRSVRPQDVHELHNWMIVAGVLQRASSTGENTQQEEEQEEEEGARIVHASTHQLWFSYAPAELSPQEAEKFHVSLPSSSPPLSANSSPPSSSGGPSSSPTASIGLGNSTLATPAASPSSSSSGATNTGMSMPLTSPKLVSMGMGRLSGMRRASSINGLAFPVAARPILKEVPAAAAETVAPAAAAAADAPAPSSSATAGSPDASTAFTDPEVFQPRMVSLLKMLSGAPGVGDELLLVLVLDAPTPRSLAKIQEQARARVVAETRVGGHLDPHAFFFACTPFHPTGMLDVLSALWSRVPSAAAGGGGAVGSTRSTTLLHPSQKSGRRALAELIDTVRDDGTGSSTGGGGSEGSVSPTAATFLSNSTPSGHVAGGGLGIAASPTASTGVSLALHSRSRSSTSFLALTPFLQKHTSFSAASSVAGGATVPAAAAAVAPAPSPPPSAGAPTPPLPPPSHQGEGGGVLLDFLVMHFGRGAFIRPAAPAPNGPGVASTTRGSPSSSSPWSSPSLPPSLERDFLLACGRIHLLCQRFQGLFLNTTASSVAAAASAAGASVPQALPPHVHRRQSSSGPMNWAGMGAAAAGGGGAGSITTVPPVPAPDAHTSAEELGKGNQVYFRRHKGMEALRHVHESGQRLLYPCGRAFWVKGRLLSNGTEVYVCCDDALPADALEAAFQAMQSE